MQTDNAVRVRLYGGTLGMETPVLSILFGEMVKRAIGVIEAYHSDLYHDAHWLKENVTGPMTFYWSPRDCGTNLGIEPQFIFRDNPGAVYYEIVLTHEGKYDHKDWYATFTQVV